MTWIALGVELLFAVAFFIVYATNYRQWVHKDPRKDK